MKARLFTTVFDDPDAEKAKTFARHLRETLDLSQEDRQVCVDSYPEVKATRTPSQERKLSEARSLAAWAVQELTDAPLTELAPRVGREPSSLSASIRRLELRRQKDKSCEEKITDLKRELELTVFQA